MISFLRRLLTRQPSELEQMRRNRDYWREAAIAGTAQMECQMENVAHGMRMIEGLREELSLVEETRRKLKTEHAALRDALIDCLAQLELTGEPFLDEAVHAGRAVLARSRP